MRRLLAAADARGIHTAYTQQLLAAFAAEPTSSAAATAAPAAQSLIDPLSERELDVLRLLATDLTGPEIADELVVSLNTMRTHTKNIYGKLAVNSRRAAVRRGEELDLL